MPDNPQRVSPVGEFRWFKLLRPQTAYDPSKPKEYSAELILRSDDPEALDYVSWVEDCYEQLKGNARKHSHWLPIKVDKEDGVKWVVRFKSNVFIDRDTGEERPGPRVMDSQKRPWPKSVNVGNGSTGRIFTRVIGWTQNNLSGLKLIPLAAQIITHVPYEEFRPEDQFDIVEGGAQAPASAEEAQEAFL